MINHFFIVGAQRCGTTYLAQLLDEHPEIEMAKPFYPEPKYFISRNSEELSRLDYLTHYFGGTDSAEIKVRGEKSTSYIEHQVAFERILGMFPEARFLVSLRNPVERAISNFRFSQKHGLENRSLSEVFLEGTTAPALADHLLSVNPFDYLNRGHYAEYLRPLFEQYGRDRFYITIKEELTGNQVAYAEILQFLQVDHHFSPPSLNRPANQSEGEIEVAERIRFELATHFEDANADLEQLIGRDLSVWA